MKVRKTLLAAAVIALIPLGASAAGDNDYGSKDKAGAGASFKQLDANKDGRISQAEAAVDSSIMFSTADTNGDGYLDNAEWKAAQKAREKDSSSPSPQSMPQGEPSTMPPSTTTPDNPSTPDTPSTQPPDTETPRQ
ncbi:MAG TPA: hypothetical protein VFL16_18630 [Steroidobacteraceae bacterium]|nr:hypothetical protein [Steroidobacteraceae bacterium]